MKKTIAILLTIVCLLGTLTGCRVSSNSSSTATVSVSTTDENGETTTHTSTATVGGEIATDGVSVNASTESNETVEKAEAPEEPEEGGEAPAPMTPEERREAWHEQFSGGAEGVSADGDRFYFAFDDPDFITYGAIMILDADESTVIAYDYGPVVDEGDGPVLYDVEGETYIAFEITDTEVEDGFEMLFTNGVTAEMHFVDQDTIIEDMNAIIDAAQG